MAFPRISRRHLLQGSAATALAATLPGRAALAKDVVVGFVYVGSRDDYGYNQAHAAGAAALKKMAGIKVVEEEKVPETDAVEKTMESRDAPVPDLVRLFQSARPQARQQIRQGAVRARRGPVDREGPEERRQLFRLYR
jgi:basic membrane lipoprotein Med (substrate-binding protein (PBP1-ABC) superfamily)